MESVPPNRPGGQVLVNSSGRDYTLAGKRRQLSDPGKRGKETGLGRSWLGLTLGRGFVMVRLHVISRTLSKGDP